MACCYLWQFGGGNETYQVHRQSALLPILRVGPLPLLHKLLALAHGVAHDGQTRKPLSLATRLDVWKMKHNNSVFHLGFAGMCRESSKMGGQFCDVVIQSMFCCSCACVPVTHHIGAHTQEQYAQGKVTGGALRARSYAF